VLEAKKTSKDPILGQKQAENYAEDIKRQTGKDLFIFLSNGYEIWFWNKPNENPRMVKGFHSREALDRILFQNRSKKDFVDVHIKKEIIDRLPNIESVKRVLEGIETGKRKLLVVQATGTGKTRVAMASIEVGLTATPAEIIDRDTFRFFDCEDSTPTTLFTYDEAVEEGYLVAYKVYKSQTHFQIAGVKPGDVPHEVMKALVEKGVEPDDV